MIAAAIVVLALGLFAITLLANPTRPCAPQVEPEWRAPIAAQPTPRVEP